MMVGEKFVLMEPASGSVEAKVVEHSDTKDNEIMGGEKFVLRKSTGEFR